MAWSVAEKKVETKRVASEKDSNRDLGGGMELLSLEFLLGVVEKAEGEEKNDVTMRKLVFNELLRRESTNEIDSKALTVYATDENKLYGKVIQCEAIKELTRRTSQKVKESS